MKKKIQISDIVVVTPVYKATMSEAEQRTITQGRKVLAAYSRVLVCPKSMDASAYLALDADLQIIALLCNSSGNDCLNAECFGNFADIEFLAFIFETRTAGDNLDIWQLRKFIDQFIRQTIR